MALVSVIIPVRNGARVLGRQLDALAAQKTDRDYEVIVADNGSTDATPEIARRGVDRFDRFDVVDASAGRGAAGARNLAASSHARGRILAFCDADDVVDDLWLDRLVAPFDGGPDPVLAAGRNISLREGRARPSTATIGEGHPRSALLGFRSFADSCNLAITAEDFSRLGGFDDSFKWIEDVDFSWRAQSAGVRFVDAPDALVFKYLSSDAWIRWRQRYRWGQEHARLYREYRDQGMPPPEQTARRYAKLAVRATLAWQPAQRDRVLSTSAEAVGHLSGSLRWRVWYP